MTIRPSTALRNEYLQISHLARESGEPIFITNKGEADGVYMSIEAYEEREKMLAHRASILAAGSAGGSVGCHPGGAGRQSGGAAEWQSISWHTCPRRRRTFLEL